MECESDDEPGLYESISVLGPPMIKSNSFCSMYHERLKNLEKWRFIIADFQYLRSTFPQNLRRKIHSGIPDCLRGAVWQRLADARSQERLLGVYQRLVLLSTDSGFDTIIVRDISRTFPKHILFRDRASKGQERLFRVLRAYAIYNPEVGYCQGMAFLAGILLFYMDDESAFLMLIALLDKHEMAGIFRPGLPLLNVRFFQLQNLLKKRDLALYQHLESHGIVPTSYASQWFMTIFSYNFPFEVVVRIWDIFLFEGTPTLFQVALAILESLKEGLMQDNLEKIHHCLNTAGANLNAKDILNLALAIEVKPETLSKLEEEYTKVVYEREDKERL